jgi:hypothetical protein
VPEVLAVLRSGKKYREMAETLGISMGLLNWIIGQSRRAGLGPPRRSRKTITTVPTRLVRVERRFVTTGYILRNLQMSAPGLGSVKVLQPKQVADFRIIREVWRRGSYLPTGLHTVLLLDLNAPTLVIKRVVM